MAMIKLFQDFYFNSDLIEYFTISCEEEFLWDVYALFHDGNKRDRQWFGQFETREDACKAIEKLMKKIGIKVVEFISDLN